MTHLFRTESSDAKRNAQRNLCGRTHYVDDDTLRYHKSRVLSSHVVDQGLLFAIVESVALDPNNRSRGVRYVIFDIFGNVVGKRQDLADCWSRSAAATKAMWADLNTLDAKAITFEAIEREDRMHQREMHMLTQCVRELETAKPEARA